MHCKEKNSHFSSIQAENSNITNTSHVMALDIIDGYFVIVVWLLILVVVL